jgi:hypothetical protein
MVQRRQDGHTERARATVRVMISDEGFRCVHDDGNVSFTARLEWQGVRG